MKTKLLFTLLFLIHFFTKSIAQNSVLWSTYYGGNITDAAYSVSADTSGNVFMAGYTPTTTGIASGGFQNTFGGGTFDGYLVKFSPTGSRIWATYYGGSGNDHAYSVTTDVSGNVYLVGKTASSSGIASGGFQNSNGGGTYDAFLVKFSSTGNRLWATYYGGTGEDVGYGVAVGSSGEVYLAGYTGSTSGIASGGFQNSYGGGTFDAFLVKFDSSGNRLWATYYGGSGIENVENGIAVDGSGRIFLGGYTSSTSGIAAGGFQNTYGGGSNDAFITKFDTSGNPLWATYYGGTGEDRGYGVTVDGFSNVYIVGRTASTSGISSGGFQNTYGGGSYDSFLAKFNGNGIRLWATYYGGTADERGEGVATDASGNVFVSGWGFSTSGIASGGYDNTFSGQNDSYLVKFDASGSRLCATYHGGTNDDYGESVVAVAGGNVYMGGYTSSTSSISLNGFQNTNGGGFDAFLTKFMSCLTTSVIENGNASPFVIFPNPSSGKFTLYSEITKGELEIYTILGERLYLFPITDPKMEMDLNNLERGIYVIRLIQDKRLIKTEKLIIAN